MQKRDCSSSHLVIYFHISNDFQIIGFVLSHANIDKISELQACREKELKRIKDIHPIYPDGNGGMKGKEGYNEKMQSYHSPAPISLPCRPRNSKYRPFSPPKRALSTIYRPFSASNPVYRPLSPMSISCLPMVASDQRSST